MIGFLGFRRLDFGEVIESLFVVESVNFLRLRLLAALGPLGIASVGLWAVRGVHRTLARGLFFGGLPQAAPLLLELFIRMSLYAGLAEGVALRHPPSVRSHGRAPHGKNV